MSCKIECLCYLANMHIVHKMNKIFRNIYDAAIVIEISVAMIFVHAPPTHMGYTKIFLS
jgi:hypothetical protein